MGRSTVIIAGPAIDALIVFVGEVCAPQNLCFQA